MQEKSNHLKIKPSGMNPLRKEKYDFFSIFMLTLSLFFSLASLDCYSVLIPCILSYVFPVAKSVCWCLNWGSRCKTRNKLIADIAIADSCSAADLPLRPVLQEIALKQEKGISFWYLGLDHFVVFVVVFGYFMSLRCSLVHLTLRQECKSSGWNAGSLIWLVYWKQ